MILRLMFGEWITEETLYPYPTGNMSLLSQRSSAPNFRFDRKLLGKLSQCAYQSLKEFFQKTLNGKEAVPGR
jgi:hypothetical protein